MIDGKRSGKREAGSGKRKVVYCVSVALLIVACTRDAQQTSRVQSTRTGETAAAARLPLPASRDSASRKTILFIGTSLTAGYGLDADSAYPQQVARMIDSAGLAYDVVNAGVSGETSSALVRRVDWLLRQPFDVVVIETGANDGLRGIPIETMQSNIQQIVERIRATRPDARIALVQMEAPPNLGRPYTERFHEVFPHVAQSSGVTLLPFLLLDVAGKRELNQADGIHPNYLGERIVARNVWKALRPLLL